MAQDINVLKRKHKINFKPHYLEPSASKGFENVILMSKKRHKFSMNICVISSLSKMCCDMFRDLCTDNKLHVQTELSNLELYKVVTFAKTGKIYGYQRLEDLLQDEESVKLFQNFGVNLSELNLSTGGAMSYGNGKRCIVRPNECVPLIVPVIRKSNSSEKKPLLEEDKVSVEDAPLLEEEFECKSELVDDTLWEGENDFKGKDMGYIGPDTGMRPDPERVKAEEPPNIHLGSLSDKPKTAQTERPEAKRNTEEDEWLPDEQKERGIKLVPEMKQSVEPSNIQLDSLDSISDEHENAKTEKSGAKRKRKTKFSEDFEWFPDEEEEMEEPTSKLTRKKKKCLVQDENAPWGKSDHSNTNKQFYFPQDEKLRDPSWRYQCKLCVRGFSEARDLEQHTLRHGAKSKKDKFFCPFCKEYMAFETKVEMKAHVKAVHENDKVACPHCNKLYGIRQRSELANHISKTHKPLLKMAWCASCGKEYKDKLSIRIHVKRMGPLHDAKCRICDNFEAKTWDENKVHFDQFHDGNVQVKCGYCPAFFTNNFLRLKHLDVCSADVPARAKLGACASEKQTCPHCAKELSAVSIQGHINYMHGTHSIPCKEPGCNVIIKHPDAIKQHMNTHLKTTCELCGWLGLKRHQGRHMQVHMDKSKRQFPCEVCNKRFSQNTQLKDHMNIHTGAKPHKCTVCNQGFASHGTMKGHVRAVHNGIKRKSK